MEKHAAKPVAYGLTVLGALARLLPHLPNFTPVGSMSLFAGARLPGWQAFLLPLALMAVTDPLVGGYSLTTPFVYAAFLVNVWLGRRLLRASESPLRIGGVCAAASVQFFLVTNFGTWLGWYPRSFEGLVACYTAAIPFFARTLLGDLFYAAVLFGLYAWLRRGVAKPAAAPAHS